MSLLHLALAYVWRRRLVSLLIAGSIGLAAGLILVVMSLRGEIERALRRQAVGFDLVVGAPGSETALVLTALFHADQPRDNIAWSTYLQISRQPGVIAAYPLSLGDSYRGLRIVGTSESFFEQLANDGSPLFSLEKGNWFRDDLELVIGAEVARLHGLAIGAKVVGAHGLADAGEEHSEHPYTVVGILRPTGTPHDRALFTKVSTYWKIHGIDDDQIRAGAAETANNQSGLQVTAVLLRVQKSRLLALQQDLSRSFGVMAVRPAEVLQRLFVSLLDPLERLLLTYGYAVLAVAAGSLLTTLYLSTLVRRRDLAILRALGALPREVFTVVVLEASILLTFGCALGVVLSRAAAIMFRGELRTRFGVQLGVLQFTPSEAWGLAAVFAIGLLAALLPAWQAYRSDVASNLAG